MLTSAVMTYTIRHLFDLMREGRIDLFPKFQRDLVWNDSHKSRFIETILLGLPFPEIFLTRSLKNSSVLPSGFAVVDGQQRLATIYQYVSGSSDFKVKGIKKFDELTSEEKYRFLDYPVVVRELNVEEEAEIFEVFHRINSVSYALNAIELTNALYEGEFIKTAREIAEDEMFADMDIFSENEFSRKKDLEFVLLVMSTVEEGGYFSGSKEIEGFVRRFDAEYPRKQKMLGTFREAIRLIHDCNLPPDSLWLRRPNLFTLIVELIRLLEEQAVINSAHLKSALLELEDRLHKSKTEDWEKNKFASYYRYLFQNTGSRAARYTRGKILNSFLKESFSSGSAEPLKQNNSLRPAERIIYDSRGGIDGFDFRGQEAEIWKGVGAAAKPVSPRAHGTLKREDGKFLNVHRTNTDGRFEIWLQRFSFDDRDYSYIPKNLHISGKRKFRISFDAKAVGGEHTLRFVIRIEEGLRLAEEAVRVSANEWKSFEVFLQFDSIHDCQLRIDDEAVSKAPSSVQISNIVVAERIS